MNTFVIKWRIRTKDHPYLFPSSESEMQAVGINTTPALIQFGFSSLGFLLFHFHTENREKKDDGYHGEGHPGDGADGEIEPEDFFRAV